MRSVIHTTQITNTLKRIVIGPPQESGSAMNTIVGMNPEKSRCATSIMSVEMEFGSGDKVEGKQNHR